MRSLFLLLVVPLCLLSSFSRAQTPEITIHGKSTISGGRTDPSSVGIPSGATGGTVEKWVSPEDVIKDILANLKIMLEGTSAPSSNSTAADMPPAPPAGSYNNAGKGGAVGSAKLGPGTKAGTGALGKGAAAGVAAGTTGPPSPLPRSALRKKPTDRWFDYPPTAGVARRTGSDPVSPGTGELVESRTDLRVPGVGMDFELIRTYRSRWDYEGPLGGGWDHSYNQRIVTLEASCSEPRRFWMTGKATVLEWELGEGGYKSIPATTFKLQAQPNGGFLLRHGDGRRSYFDGNGLLERVVDLAGNSIEVSWEVAPEPDAFRVQSVTDTQGRVFEFGYGAGGLQTVGYSSPSLGLVRVFYFVTESTRNLVAAVSPAGVWETYDYMTPEVADDDVSYVHPDNVDSVCRQSCEEEAFCDTSASGTQDCATEAVSDCKTACDSPQDYPDWANHCETWCSAETFYTGNSLQLAGDCGQACMAASATCRSAVQDVPCVASCLEASDDFETNLNRRLDEGCGLGCLACSYQCAFKSSDPCAQTLGPLPGDQDRCKPYPGGPKPEHDDCCWQASVDYCAPNECKSIAPVSYPGDLDMSPCIADCKASVDVPKEKAERYLSCVDPHCGFEGQEPMAAVCLGGCINYCNDPDQCNMDCLDPVNCKASCDAEKPQYETLCTVGCINSCIGTLRGQGYGSARDLLHNLVAIRGGDGSAYLVNTYGTDKDAPGFDRVISQTFGETTTSYAYYPLEDGVAGIATEDKPLVDVTTLLPDMCPCPNVKTDPPTGPTWWLEIERGLYGLGVGPGRRSGRSRVSPERMNVEGIDLDSAISFVLLELTDDRLFSPMTRSPTLSRVQVAIRPALSMRTFRLRTSTGTWLFERGKDLRGDGVTYQTSGEVAGLRTLFEGGKVSIVRSGTGLFAFTGELRGAVELTGGRCAGDFGLALESSDTATALGTPVCDGPVQVRALGGGMSPFRGEFGRAGEITTLSFGQAGFSMSSSPGDFPSSECNAPTPRRPDIAAGANTVSPPGPDAPLLPPTPETVVCWFPPEEVSGCIVDAKPFYTAEGVLEDKAALATVIRDGEGTAWTYYSDDGGRVVKMVSHATQSYWSQTYDTLGRRSGYRSEYGDRHCWDYDGDWNLAWHTRYPAFSTPGTPWITVGQEWTAHQRLKRRYRPNTMTPVMEVDWNTLNGAVSETRAYPTPGVPLATKYTSDLRGRVTKRQSYDASLMTIDYDDATGLPNYMWSGGEGPAAGTEPVESHRLYDDLGRVVASYGTAESTSVQVFNLDGLMSEVTVALEPSLIASYTMTPDDDGRVASVVGQGLRQEFDYDARGLLRSQSVSSLADPSQSRTTCYRYNQQLRLIETVTPTGRRLRLKRDGYGNVYETLAGAPAKVSTTTNAWDAKCAAPTPEIQAPFEVSSSATLNALGVPETQTSWPFVTATSYDGYGRPVQRIQTTVQPDEKRDVVRRWSWDASDNVAAVAVLRLAPGLDPTGTAFSADVSEPHLLARSTIQYDALGRQTSVRQSWFVDVPDKPRKLLGTGLVTSFTEYQDAQRRVVATDADGVTMTTTFDGLGRTASETWADGTARSYTWSNGGLRLLTETQAPVTGGKLVESAEWTRFGALKSAERGGSVQYAATFTPRGELALATTPLESTSYEYSAFGEVLHIQRQALSGSASNTLLRYNYTTGGTLSAVEDGGGSRTSFLHDHMGRLTRTTYEGTGTEMSQSYLAGSQVPLRSTQRDGVTYRFAYGPFGDVREVSALQNGEFLGQLSVLTTANGVRESTSIVNGKSTLLSHVVDSLGRRAESRQSNSAQPVSLGWTPAGRLKTTEFAGLGLQRNYDAAGHWKDIQSTAVGAKPMVKVGRVGFTPTMFTWLNGIVEQLKFDALGEGIERTARQGLKTLSTRKVQRTAGGVPWRRDSTISGVSHANTIARDGFGRLTHELSGALADAPATPPTQAALDTKSSGLWRTSFDAANNPQMLDGKDTTLATHNQMTSAHGKVVKYDAAGRLIRLGDERFTYGPFGRLVTAQGPLGRWRYEYDASSVLVGWKRESGRAPPKSLEGVSALPLTSGEFVRVDQGGVQFVDAFGVVLAQTGLVGDVVGVAGSALLSLEVKGKVRTVRRFSRVDGKVAVSAATLGGVWEATTTLLGASAHSEGLDVVSVTGKALSVQRYQASNQSSWLLQNTFTGAAFRRLSKPLLIATSPTKLVVIDASGVGKYGSLTQTNVQILGDIDVRTEVTKPISVALHSSGALVVASLKSGALVTFKGTKVTVSASPHRGVVSATTGFDRRGKGGGFFSAAHGETLVGPEEMTFHHQGVALVAAGGPDGHRVLFGHGDDSLPMVGLSSDGPTFMHRGVGPRLAMLTSSQGKVLESYQSGAYGNVRVMSAMGVETHASILGVTIPMGQPRFGPAGLSRFGMRWYRPNLLRWMTPDPIGLAGGANLYGYVGNMPLSYWDPFGLSRLGIPKRLKRSGFELLVWLERPLLNFSGFVIGVADALFLGIPGRIMDARMEEDKDYVKANSNYYAVKTTTNIVGTAVSIPALARGITSIALSVVNKMSSGGGLVVAGGGAAGAGGTTAAGVGAILETGVVGANALESLNRLYSEGLGGSAPGASGPGAARAARHGQNWQGASLKKTIDRVAGQNPKITTTPQKTVFSNPKTGVQVVYDNAGNYFRVENPGVSGALRYLDQFGKPIPANVPLIGPKGVTHTGVPGAVRRALTHFMNID